MTYSFDWNLPDEMDPDEPECVVTFEYQAQCGCGRRDCACATHDTSCMEDIHVLYDGEDWEKCDLHPGWYASFRDACFTHLDELSTWYTE